MSPLNVVGKKGCCEQRWCHNQMTIVHWNHVLPMTLLISNLTHWEAWTLRWVVMNILLVWLIDAKILTIVRPMVVKILVMWWTISKKLAIVYVVIYFRWLQCPPIFVEKIKQINEHKGWKKDIWLKVCIIVLCLLFDTFFQMGCFDHIHSCY